MIKNICVSIDNELYQLEVTEMEHPIQSMFHVSFEDGYENIFFRNVENGEWVEQDIGETILARCIGNNIEQSYQVDDPIKSLSRFEIDTGSGTLRFLYYKFMSTGFTLYEVYAVNKRYMFTLVRMKDFSWQLYKMPGSYWNYPDAYSDEIPYFIELFNL